MADSHEGSELCGRTASWPDPGPLSATPHLQGNKYQARLDKKNGLADRGKGGWDEPREQQCHTHMTVWNRQRVGQPSGRSRAAQLRAPCDDQAAEEWVLGRETSEGGGICVHRAESTLLPSRDHHNTVKWLHSNKIGGLDWVKQGAQPPQTAMLPHTRSCHINHSSPTNTGSCLSLIGLEKDR